MFVISLFAFSNSNFIAFWYADGILGPRALQGYIDAGLPADNTFLESLLRDVLFEHIQAMLGRKEDSSVPEMSKATAAAQTDFITVVTISCNDLIILNILEIEVLGVDTYSVDE